MLFSKYVSSQRQPRRQIAIERRPHLGVGREIAHPFVINALRVGDGDARLRHAREARFLMRRRCTGCIRDRHHAVAGTQETDRRMGDADIGLQSHQHALPPPGCRHRRADIFLPHQTEHFLVEDDGARRQFGHQCRHHRAVRLDILGRGDDGNVELARHPHQPGDACHKRLPRIERQLVEKILLHIDHDEATFLPRNQGMWLRHRSPFPYWRRA